MESSRQTKVAQLDMTVFVYQYVIGLDISVRYKLMSDYIDYTFSIVACLPMHKSHLVYKLNCKNAFGDIKTSYVFREGIVLDQHGHQIATR